MSRLDEIRALRSAITPGQWKLIRYDRGGGRIYVAGEHDGGAAGEQRALVLDTDTREPDGVATAYHEGDREFFFAAPGAVDWLVAEVDRLTAALASAHESYRLLTEDERYPGAMRDVVRGAFVGVQWGASDV